MQPSKPFLYAVVALLAVGGAVVIPTYSVREAAAKEGMPLSTRLTPAMIDYFGVSAAFDRPSMAALLACHAAPACATSDTLRVRFLNAAGRPVSTYDGASTTIIEQVRRGQSTLDSGVTETRHHLRRYSKDEQGRVVMSGTDSIVKVDRGGRGRESSTLTRVHRFSDVRYLVNDPTFVWPLTGLVVLELSNAVGAAPRVPVRLASHGAVSFDGTKYAHVLTTSALTHKIDLAAKLLETIMPDR